jgi:hypothetical protein
MANSSLHPKSKFSQSLRLRLSLFILLFLISTGGLIFYFSLPAPIRFDGERAYTHVLKQLAMGPRTPGSLAHTQVITYIQKSLEADGWRVDFVEGSRLNHPIKNIRARRGNGQPWTILGAHFDSRFSADQETNASLRSQPVPGANDGASGVAVLLELAHVLPKDLPGQVELAFFDAEDQGNLPGWEWILGSNLYAQSLNGQPDAVIVIDMIGDANLNVYYERGSDTALSQEIWASAAALGYQNQLISEIRYQILDDHLPFVQKGIRAVDIIDFDYPDWHKTSDTSDKVSPKSLEIIGGSLYHWLVNKSK